MFNVEFQDFNSSECFSGRRKTKSPKRKESVRIVLPIQENMNERKFEEQAKTDQQKL